MSDIVERLLMAQFRLDDGPEVATMERQAEVDRLAALIRERFAAGDACAKELARVDADLMIDPPCPNVLRHRAAVEACGE